MTSKRTVYHSDGTMSYWDWDTQTRVSHGKPTEIPRRLAEHMSLVTYRKWRDLVNMVPYEDRPWWYGKSSGK